MITVTMVSAPVLTRSSGPVRPGKVAALALCATALALFQGAWFNGYMAGLASSLAAVLPVPDDEATRASRFALCDLTARTLAKGLDLLGIEHLEQM